MWRSDRNCCCLICTLLFVLLLLGLDTTCAFSVGFSVSLAVFLAGPIRYFKRSFASYNLRLSIFGWFIRYCKLGKCNKICKNLVRGWCICARQIALACTMAFVANPSWLSGAIFSNNCTTLPNDLTTLPNQLIASPILNQSTSFNYHSRSRKNWLSSYGRPGNRGGGSRLAHLRTALTPVTNWGKTVSPPHFWFYVPYSPNEEHSGEFVLQDGKI